VHRDGGLRVGGKRDTEREQRGEYEVEMLQIFKFSILRYFDTSKLRHF
jgi:hypothetical protein